ncbi:cation/H(+) antiporter, partial [Chryseobacterium phosphatilyticum]
MIIRKLISSAKDEDRWIYGLLWLALCSLGADWAGLHYMVGAFLSGAVLDSKWFKIEKMDAFRNNILISIMPFYFLSTGLKTTWEMGGAGAFVASGILLAVSVAAKILGMVASGRILNWELSESLLIGWLLQTKALILI